MNLIKSFLLIVLLMAGCHRPQYWTYWDIEVYDTHLNLMETHTFDFEPGVNYTGNSCDVYDGYPANVERSYPQGWYIKIKEKKVKLESSTN